MASLSQTLALNQDSIYSWCSSTSAVLRSSDYEHGPQIHALVAQLRLLAGSLHSLQRLALELEEEEDRASEAPKNASGDRPSDAADVLSRCEEVPDMLRRPLDGATPTYLSQAATTCQTYRAKIDHVVTSSKSRKDVELNIGLLFGEGPFAEPERTPANSTMTPASVRPEPDFDLYPPTAADVCGWLDLLNSPEYDREPEEYYKEVANRRKRRVRCPQYQTAALEWPRQAKKHWDQIAVRACRLLQPGRNYRLAQWVIEYAETSPAMKSDDHLTASPRAIIALSDLVCSEAPPAFQIAAALSLHDLCESLAQGSPKGTHLLPTPAMCALLGPKALLPGELTTLDDVLGGPVHMTQALAETARMVMRLDVEGADRRWTFKNGESGSVPILAFWTAFVASAPSLFRPVLRGDYKLDKYLGWFIRSAPIFAKRKGIFCSTEVFAELVLDLFDYLVQRLYAAAATFDRLTDDSCLRIIRDLINHRSIPLTLRRGANIPAFSKDLLDQTMMWAILDEDIQVVERLSSDSRFDHTADINGDSAIHLAVASNQLETTRILIQNGADLTVTDAEGRTPLLTVESVEMAELLVRHGAPTRALDNQGRNVWHLMAATNDAAILIWLSAKDPYKKENLLTRSMDGNTPLAEAFQYLSELAAESSRAEPRRPTAAYQLLRDCREWPESLASETPLPHLAAAWGDEVLVRDLSCLGADFQALDYDGRSVLHHLNFSAETSFVHLLQDLCTGVNLFDNKNTTPAESIIDNLVLDTTDRLPALSAHPSCRSGLDREAYDLLLTPEFLELQSGVNKGPWLRVCRSINGMMRKSIQKISPGASGSPPVFDRIFMSAAIVFEALIDAGALREYERCAKTSAIGCLVLEDQTVWETYAEEESDRTADLLAIVLKESDDAMLENFLRSFKDVAAMLAPALELAASS